MKTDAWVHMRSSPWHRKLVLVLLCDTNKDHTKYSIQITRMQKKVQLLSKRRVQSSWTDLGGRINEISAKTVIEF